MTKKRNLFWLIPLLLLLTYPFWRPIVADFLNPPGKPAPRTVVVQSGRSFTMKDVIFSQYNAGRQEWNITAQTLYSPRGENNYQMEDIYAVFYGKKTSGQQARSATLIRGENGLYEKDKNILTLTDNVTLTTDDGHKMRTNELRYLEKSRQLIAFSDVLITGHNFMIKGQGLTYDQDSGDFQVKGRVYADTW